MLFEMSLIRPRKLNKLLSRAENKILSQLIGSSCECLVNGVVHVLPYPDRNGITNSGSYSTSLVNDDIYENDTIAVTVKPGNGVICLLKDKTFEAAYVIRFYSLIQARLIWGTVLDYDSQVQRPRPDLVILVHKGSSVLLRFIVVEEANTFCTMAQLAISEIKQKSGHSKLSKQDISLPSDFRNLDLAEWNLLRGEQSDSKPAKQSRLGRLKPILMKKHNTHNRNVKVPSQKELKKTQKEQCEQEPECSETEHKRTIMESLKKMVHMPNIKLPLHSKRSLPSFQKKNNHSGISLISEDKSFEGDDDEAPLLI